MASLDDMFKAVSENFRLKEYLKHCPLWKLLGHVPDVSDV